MKAADFEPDDRVKATWGNYLERATNKSKQQPSRVKKGYVVRHRATTSHPTLQKNNIAPVLLPETITGALSILIVWNSCSENQTTFQWAICQRQIIISEKINDVKIAMYTDQGPIAASCYQQYTVVSSLWGPKKVMGMELAASSCAKGYSLMPGPTFKALQPIDNVGGRSYIECCWYNISAWFL